MQLAFKYDSDFVWTVVDCGENPSEWIIPGFHRINRICFLLTEIAHHDVPIEFRIARVPHSMTPLGLARRITVLKRILVAQTGL